MNFKNNLALLIVFILFQSVVNASEYTPLSVTGFNADVVCSSLNCAGTNSLDQQWFYYSAGKKADGALPQNITSKMGIDYVLASFEDKNALTLSNNGAKTGTLSLETPVQAKELWLLGLSASGERNIDVIVNYTDNTNSPIIKISFSDWFQSDGSRTAYYGLGRVNSSGSFDGRLQFGFFERVIPTDNSKTIKSIQFAYNGSETTYTSIFAVSSFNGVRTTDNDLYMISNAHFDTQWDWDVQTSIDQYVKNTLEGNFNLFEKYPNYKFNFEGAIKYMFAKEYYPDLYEKLKGYVASGRWRISGGSIDANDVMVPSAESVIRNFLLGQEFYKKEFGIKGGSDIMLPDCFGFPYTLPTLGVHCGITGFHSQKLSWGSAYNYNDLPHFGLWRGVDGSEIYAVHKAGAYVNQYKENLSYNGDILNEIIANKAKTGSNRTVRYFGTGDRGGSIDESTADWMEKSISSDGPVNVKMVSPDEFFDSFSPEERANLPVWDNELPMKAHGVGCYTSQTILKYWNRKGELLADATEKTSVVADWLGALPYQHQVINDNWIRLLWHQFHDDLTGTSIPRAYGFTYNDHIMAQLNFAKTLNNAAGAVIRQLDTRVQGIPVVVYNPLSIQRDDIVEAQIQLNSLPEYISVYNPEGVAVPAQIVDYSNGVLLFIFKASIPSLGYASYDLRVNDNASSKLQSSLITTANTIENTEYIVKVNKNGDVYSIIDKKQGNKELLKSPIRMSLQSNNPGYWASWEISYGDVARSPMAYVDENVQVSLDESGPLRASLKITRSKFDSKYVQFIRMTSGVNEDRVDFVNEVDWQTKETLLKVIFPLNANNPNATYDSSIGAIKRGNNKENLYEVAGHQWADLTHIDNSYGVSILNDSKYGWDKPDNNTLRLTLIHTPGTGNDRSFQKYQDLGLNKFTYSFYRHLGNWDETTQWAGSKLNQPVLAYQAQKNDGAFGKTLKFADVNTDKVAIKAFKKAEASDDFVVRVYELVGENHQNVELNFASNVISAVEVNGLEEEVGSIPFSGNKISFSINKFQPKSFKIKLAKSDALELKEPESRQATLVYNVDVMSNDMAKRDGRFGVSNFSFPSELLEDEIVADGIKFKIGPRENQQLNAVKSVGQDISIPQSQTNKKLYILAASQNSEGSDVKFLLDGVEKPMKIEYFAEQIGTFGTVYSSENYKKENIAHVATHRHNYSANKNDSYSYLYIYKYVVEIDANSKTLTLPNNEDVVVFAVTASDNENDDVTPITEIEKLPEFEFLSSDTGAEACGVRMVPDRITASGSTNANERPANAGDNNPYTKWNDDRSSSKWIQYTYQNPITICGWNVLHAGLENDNYITADFALQYRDGVNWVDVDIVSNNTQNKTIRSISPITTDAVRIKIIKGQQDGGSTARIYSFDIIGNAPTGLIGTKKKERSNVSLSPNPFKHSTKFDLNFTAGTDKVFIDVYDVAGSLVSNDAHHTTVGDNTIVWNNEKGLKGMFFYKISVRNSGVIKEFATGKMIII